MTEQEKKEALKRWQEHCKRVERMTSQERVETEAERKRNIARALRLRLFLPALPVALLPVSECEIP